MRLSTLNAFIGLSILLIAGLVIVLAGSFLSRLQLQQPNIPPLSESSAPQTEIDEINCDPVVIAMDADGNVYSGKNVIGSLADPLDLTTKLKEVFVLRAARLAYTSGMDINLEVPSRCLNETVYIKADGRTNHSRIAALTRALREVGVSPTRLIFDRQK